MNFLSLFVLIPILMLGGLFLSRNMKQIRWVAATGASLLLVLSVVLTFLFLGERAAGNDAEMLFMAEMPWFTPLNINYSVGVDGISVAMLLLSSVIVFTGVFASWKIDPLPKELSCGSACSRRGFTAFSFRSTSSRCSSSMKWR